MTQIPRVWLVCNEASGSNDEEALVQLRGAFDAAGRPIDRVIRFQREPAPDAAALKSHGVDLLAVFAGDGTTHAVVTGAYGWDGAVLVLPGGTMNMLSKALHGDVPAARIVGKLADAAPRRVRPPVIRTRHGDGLSGALAGPGAVWNDVREAIRSSDVGRFVSATTEAISRSANDPGVICPGLDCKREGGYTAITLTPCAEGIAVKGYYAETIGDYAGQGLALLQRDFREGPHDDLGHHPRISVASTGGNPLDLLIDGEPLRGGSEEQFVLARCGVDLLATGDAR